MNLGKNWTTVLILLSVVVYVGFCAYLGNIGHKDYWMVRAFDADESVILKELVHMFDHRTFEPAFYWYGAFQQYIALLSLYCLEFFSKPEIKDAVFILRFENALAGGGVIALVFLMSKELSSPMAGVYSVAFLLFNSVFLIYGYNAKPELLQLFFITGSLFFGMKGISSDRWWFLAMGIMGGLAFITKFAGLFLLPMGVLAAFLSVHKRECCFRKKLREIVVKTSMVFIGFSIAVTFFSPYMLRDFDLVIERLAIQTQINKEGYLFFADDYLFQWFLIIFNSNFLGYSALLIYCTYLIDFIRAVLCRSTIPKDLDKEFFLFVWVFFYGLYTIFGVVVRAERYMLPILPVLVIFAGLKVNKIIESKKLGSMQKMIFAGVIFMLLLPNLFMINNLISISLVRENSPRIVAGEWVVKKLPADAKIASNLYTYVPPSFTKHLHSKYLSIQDVHQYQPEYIVSSREISQRFLDISRSKKFTLGEHEYMLRYTLYRGLREGSLRDYFLLKDFGEVQIYAKSKKIANL